MDVPIGGFLRTSEVVDWDHPAILQERNMLSQDGPSTEVYTQRAFEWVRDEVRHSFDHSLNPITWKASQVLEHKTGYCFAKSHLLVALLRAQGIPAGFHYQTIWDDDDKVHYLHGLVGVYLPRTGWYRLDPRGNKKGINARFMPPQECLAYAPSSKVIDDPQLYAEPKWDVVDLLKNCRTFQEVLEQLPSLNLPPSR